MIWLVLLVVTGLATASDLKLGDRILATEKECARIKKLNENWTTANYHEEATQYVDIYIICEDSLNEDKYKYIHENKMDLSWYPDTFKIETSDGEKDVTKPPPKHSQIMSFDSAKKILAKYITKEGGKLNPIYRRLHIQSEKGQDIVDKQVECEELGLVALKNPEDPNNESNHDKCLTELYCMKERFMEQRGFTREHYREYFPILYKQKGIMIKTPPTFDQSVCESSEKVKGSKRELEKWINGIEVIGEKLANVGEVGTDFIDKLLKRGAHGGEKVLTREELSALLENAASVTVTDDDDDGDDNGEAEHKNTLKVYGDLLADKLAELRAKGVNIAYKELDKAKPTLEKVENLAQAGKQAIKEMRKGTEDDESTEDDSSNEKDSSLMSTLIPNSTNEGKEETSTSNSDDGKIDKDDEAIPNASNDEKEETTANSDDSKVEDVNDTNSEPSPDPNESKIPTPLQILKDISGHGGKEEIKLSEAELRKTVQSLKESTKKKLEASHLSKKDVLQSAEIVKNVINTLLTTAGQGYGTANDMIPQEIEKAKSLVNELVNYATVEILGQKDKDVADQDDDDDDEDDDEENMVDRKMPFNGEDKGSNGEGKEDTEKSQAQVPSEVQLLTDQNTASKLNVQNKDNSQDQNIIPTKQNEDSIQIIKEGGDKAKTNPENEVKVKLPEGAAAQNKVPQYSGK